MQRGASARSEREPGGDAGSAGDSALTTIPPGSEPAPSWPQSGGAEREPPGRAGGAPTEAACDFRGNRIPSKPVMAWYLLLRTPEEGPEPGLYWGAYKDL